MSDCSQPLACVPNESGCDFEAFHPDRIVGRILGMGDIATLLERAEVKLDKNNGEGFSLEDFRYNTMSSGGSMGKMKQHLMSQIDGMQRFGR